MNKFLAFIRTGIREWCSLDFDAGTPLSLNIPSATKPAESLLYVVVELLIIDNRYLAATLSMFK